MRLITACCHVRMQAEHLFKALILATNMQRHHDVLAAATDAAARPSSLGSRTAVLSALVHIADIFNPCRPVDIAIRFGTQVALESAAQVGPSCTTRCCIW